MLGPRNIHILLIYGIKNGVHVVECCLYTIFRVSGILRHFWCSYARANSITPSDSNTPSRTLASGGPPEDPTRVSASVTFYFAPQIRQNNTKYSYTPQKSYS